MTTPKVYIPNKSYHNFSDAKRFGELIYLTVGKISIMSTGRMFRTFHPLIEESSPEDYILISGPSVMTSLLCAMFSHKHGVLNLLIFQIEDRGPGFYKQRRIDFTQQTTEED